MPQIVYDLPPPKWGSFANHPSDLSRTIIVISQMGTLWSHLCPSQLPLPLQALLSSLEWASQSPSLFVLCHHSQGLAQVTDSLLPGSSASNLSRFPVPSTDIGPTWFLKLLSSQQFLSPEAICLSHEIQILIASQAPEQPFPQLYPSVGLSVQFITSSSFRL